MGAGDLEGHIAHAQGFVEILRSAGPPATVVDLGSGGGLPGFVVADGLPDTQVTLLESSESRCTLLQAAVDACGWGARVRVHHERAESAARRPQLRGGFEAAVSRSFGKPAVVAECGAPLLTMGGWLVVSEPPEPLEPPERSDVVAEHSERWPEAGLALVGLTTDAVVRHRFGYRVLRLRAACPDRYPRRPGVPAKRPLF